MVSDSQRRITIDLDSTAVTALVLEDKAPVTAQRLWDQLPFEDRFTHSIWSGLMIHSHNHPKLELDVSRYPLAENAVAYLAAGDIVVWPPDGTLGIAYGPTQFRWMTGAWVVTKIGQIEGDLAAFARACYRMMFEGARRVTISPGGGRPEMLEIQPVGKLIEIEYDGMTWVAELLESEAPEYALAVWDALPLEGITTITHSSGEVLHFWCRVPEPANRPSSTPKVVPVQFRGQQVGVTSVAFDPLAMRGQHPGDLVWGSTWNGIRIVYGQGHFGTPSGKFGRIVRGDLEAFAEKARRIPWEGAGFMRMRRYAGAL
jgi:hypothetical protein